MPSVPVAATQDDAPEIPVPAMSGLPGSLAALGDYTTGRVSSANRQTNDDRKPIGPHETLTLAEISGPAEITHLWTTISTKDTHHLRNLVLRIYWDGNKFPSVESPIGDFYGLGHGRYYYFNNPVQAIGTKNGMNAFWPMPFAKSARITVTNDSQTSVRSFYYYVDYRRFKSMPSGLAYFHAQYHQDMPTHNGRPYLIMQTSGGAGHFVGCNLSILTESPGWWGEGDDMMMIDGETSPSIWGTGSEDYFAGAWGFGKTFYTNYFGMPLRDKMNHDANNYWNVYRLHLANPVAFTKSIKVEIEHGDNGVSNRRSPRNNDYASCAYWYVDKPRPLVGHLPAAKKRWPHYALPAELPGILEPQYFHYQTGEKWDIGSFKTDKIADGDKLWLNSDYLRGMKMTAGERLTMDFDTTAPMQGEGALVVTVGGDYGPAEVELDGKTLANYDGHAAELGTRVIRLPSRLLPAGHHKMTVGIPDPGTGNKNSAPTKQTNWGIDYLRVGGQALPIENQSQTGLGNGVNAAGNNGTSAVQTEIRIDEL
jgi:hypothetical protein